MSNQAHPPRQLPRSYFRKQRRRLSTRQRKQLARQASRHLHKLQNQLPKNAKVAIYYDGFGELPTQRIVDWCLRLGYQVYLPVVGSFGNLKHGRQDRRLRFARIHHNKLSNLPTYTHALGMKQTYARQLVWASELDIIICPLVAVDYSGTRMGMGGGYYDRTLARPYKFKGNIPLKVGWCYDFQFIDRLERQSWDVPMDMVISPSRLIVCKKNQSINTALKARVQSNAQSSTANAVTKHLKGLEKHATQRVNSNNLVDAEFSDDELARLVNPQRLQQLMHQADGFLTGLEGLLEDYE